MEINDEQAINYVTGLVITMKNKIDIFDSQSKDTCENEDLYVSSDERYLCASLEIVLNKAKSNILINPDMNKKDEK
jgi:hypothetical protein